MASGVSNRNLVRYSLLTAIPKKLRDVAHKKTKDIASDILEGVIHATPEDLSHAVGNWQVGIGSGPTDIIEGSDPNGSEALSRGQATIASVRLGPAIHIVNNVDYMAQLIAGSSTQAPADFVNKEVQKAVRKNAR